MARQAHHERSRVVGYESLNIGGSAGSHAAERGPFASPSSALKLADMKSGDLSPVQGDDTFDYVIVGGGSAGCVLANRLSGNPGHRVCLLEAGPSDHSYWIRSCNPLNMAHLMYSRKYNWRYETEADRLTGNRRFYWPRGKGLGGSSSINAMIYTRGHPWDYDHWAELGNPGWDFASVLPWFKLSEHQQRGAGEWHGVSGPMDVVDTTFHFASSEAFVKACAEAGLGANDDFNGASQEGCGFFQVTQTPQGRRCNSAYAFLDPVLSRPNLSVRTQAHVARVLLEGRRAVGVTYHDLRAGRQLRQLKARREVILCGGVINSPQLLMLSGVGPGRDLNVLGIDVVHDLPGVGGNLQDHPDILIRHRDRALSSLSPLPSRETLRFSRRYFGKSPPFVFTPTDCGGFVKSDQAEPIPDLQLQFAAIRMEPHGRDLGMALRPGYVLHICHLRPESRGRIRLRSKDPFEAPAIEANYFSSNRELEALVKGLKLCRRILAQQAMRPFDGGEEVPGPAVQSDDELRRFLLERIETVYHTAGTCKMGHDPLAVVDSQLRVHGVDNLRVIDSSIMPTITGSNIHAPTVMIAERGARMLLAGCGPEQCLTD